MNSNSLVKRGLVLLCAVGVMTAGLSLEAAQGKPKADTKVVQKVKRGSLVHMVSFKFKPEAPAAKVREVEEAFAALPGKIQEIVSFEWGTNVSPEKLDKGFTHGFILTFRNEKDRDAYLVHPDHKAFGALVGPVLADVFVVDFVAKK